MARPLRYTFILALTALAATLAAVGGWRYARASAPVNGPIVVISIDTLRADHLPAYGYHKVKTPAIDALAADGVLFERAYSHVPETLPAHVSILSGRLPFDTGVSDASGSVVRKGEHMLAQLLRDRGYATGGVVSASLLRKETGIGQGFDFFDDEMPPASPDMSIGQIQRDGGESEAIAERWLNRQRSSRLFLFLHLYEPHKPYTPPERFAAYAPYDGEIAYADEIVGRLIRYLKAHQLYDGSTIVLLSDHGEGLGDHGEQEHGLFLYDEAIHVPLIVKQAAGIGAGRRVPDLVQHVDLVPTILELVKAPFPGNLRGRSLTPLLDGTGHLSEQPVYSEAPYGSRHFGWSALAAVTDGRYAYINAPREELYDLRQDPGERQNVAAERTSERQAFAARLARIVPPPKAGAAVRAGDPADPKDTVEIVETYRAAADLAASRKWADAIRLLQSILKRDESLAEVWRQLATDAMRIDRNEQAADAYARVCELEPADANGYLGAASALLKLHKLDDARDRADRVVEIAGEKGGRLRAAGHELLARIALARHDADAARDEADLVRQTDPDRPLPAFVEARLLYDQGKYEAAAPLLEEAIAALKRSHGQPIAELHFYAADTFARLARPDEAEAEYVEELREAPENTRASAGLAALYQATGRPDEASRVLTEMLQITPTPESYALAARLWRSFGNVRQAEAIRAEARRAFAETR